MPCRFIVYCVLLHVSAVGTAALYSMLCTTAWLAVLYYGHHNFISVLLHYCHEHCCLIFICCWVPDNFLPFCIATLCCLGTTAACFVLWTLLLYRRCCCCILQAVAVLHYMLYTCSHMAFAYGHHWLYMRYCVILWESNFVT